uniref:Uncharacterized protein n=1 Tax=Anguilla anguilla TaxID=7936 RepID=A0A0E9T5S1_ANGAN
MTFMVEQYNAMAIKLFQTKVALSLFQIHSPIINHLT